MSEIFSPPLLVGPYRESRSFACHLSTLLAVLLLTTNAVAQKPDSSEPFFDSVVPEESVGRYMAVPAGKVLRLMDGVDPVNLGTQDRARLFDFSGSLVTDAGQPYEVDTVTPSVAFDYAMVKEHKDIVELVSLAAKVEGRIGPVGIDAEYKETALLEFSERHVHVVAYVTSLWEYAYAKDVKLRPMFGDGDKVRELAKSDPASFVEHYGSRFVSGVAFGYSCFGVYTFSDLTTTEISELSSIVEGKYAGAKVVAEFEKFRSEVNRRVKVSFMSHSSFGTPVETTQLLANVLTGKVAPGDANFAEQAARLDVNRRSAVAFRAESNFAKLNLVDPVADHQSKQVAVLGQYGRVQTKALALARRMQEALIQGDQYAWSDSDRAQFKAKMSEIEAIDRKIGEGVEAARAANSGSLERLHDLTLRVDQWLLVFDAIRFPRFKSILANFDPITVTHRQHNNHTYETVTLNLARPVVVTNFTLSMHTANGQGTLRPSSSNPGKYQYTRNGFVPGAVTDKLSCTYVLMGDSYSGPNRKYLWENYSRWTVEVRYRWDGIGVNYSPGVLYKKRPLDPFPNY